VNQTDNTLHAYRYRKYTIPDVNFQQLPDTLQTEQKMRSS